MALADLPLKTFLQVDLVPYEEDEVSRLIHDSHDPAAFAAVSHLTVGQFREWLLDTRTTTDRLTALAPGVTPEMAAAVSKIMRVQDLIVVARQMQRHHRIPQHDRTRRSALHPAAAEPSDRRFARHCRQPARRPPVRRRRRGDRRQPGDRQRPGLHADRHASRRGPAAPRHSDSDLLPRPCDDSHSGNQPRRSRRSRLSIHCRLGKGQSRIWDQSLDRWPKPKMRRFP